MTHPVSCETARGHDCGCSTCGGAQHGWTHGLRLARDPSPAARQGERDRNDSDWAATLPPRKRQEPSRRRKAAATDSATVDLVDWLSENPETIEQIQAVGNILSGPVVLQLDETFGGDRPRAVRRKLTDHFWCDLLVAAADAMEKFSKALDQIPEYMTAIIVRARDADRRAPLLDGLVALAVRTAWEPIKNMIHTTGVKELQRTCRILSVLICPAPENHKAVRDGALLPLAKEGLLGTSKERLEQVFPADWVQRLREGLDGA
ncbi:hypothetical protein AB0K48_09835 [Nonomuraea sp. NPDC055795]